MIPRGTREIARDDDVVLARLSTGPLATHLGEFDVSVFHDGHEEAIVLSKGSLGGERDVPCRIHSECLSAHVFLSEECDCREQMRHAQELISQEGRGLIIYLRQEGRGNGAAAHVSTLGLKREGISQDDAYLARGYRGDLRTYDLAAKIVNFYNIGSIRLLSSNVKKMEELERHGVRITSHLDLSESVTILDQAIENVIDYATLGIHQPIPRPPETLRIFVIGDLNIDYLVSQKSFLSGGIMEKPTPLVGGTAFNAARAFKSESFYPILFGKVGRDPGAETIKDALTKCKITALLAESEHLPSGECTILYFEHERKRVIIQEGQNANDYDLVKLRRAVQLAQIDDRDLFFLIGHEFVRSGPAKVRELIELLASRQAPVVLDVVPHNVYEKVSRQEFCEAIASDVSVLLGEFHTFMAFLGRKVDEQSHPTNADVEDLFAAFRCKTFVLRYGVGSISRQMICRRENGSAYQTLEDKATEYETTPDAEKLGFGDRLTADLIRRFGAELWKP